VSGLLPGVKSGNAVGKKCNTAPCAVNLRRVKTHHKNLFMTLPTHNTDVLIIGAGLAGLSAANHLQRAGYKVLVVDKGRGLGGRLAGRRIDNASFDHGAQFMTTRDPKFVEQVREWIEAGVAKEWYSSFPGQANSHARYRGVPTMTAIAKHLAVDISVKLGTTVTSLNVNRDGWLCQLNNGTSIQSRSLVITSPVPQTLVLLDSGNIQLPKDKSDRLNRISYESCIAVMAVLDQPSAIAAPGAMAIETGPIAWISDNQQKGVSAIPAVTIHGSGDFSAKHFDSDRDQVAQQLIQAASPYLGAAVVDFQVHGWRYSKPIIVDNSPCMVVSESTDLPALVLAGDAFAGPRVEGAVLSGWAAAKSLIDA
jgi:renalase